MLLSSVKTEPAAKWVLIDNHTTVEILPGGGGNSLSSSSATTTSGFSSTPVSDEDGTTKTRWDFKNQFWRGGGGGGGGGGGVSRTSSSSSSSSIYVGDIISDSASELNSPDVIGGYLGHSISSLAQWLLGSGRDSNVSPRSSSPDPPKTVPISDSKRGAGHIGHKKYRSVSEVDLKSGTFQSRQPSPPPLPHLESFLRVQPLASCARLWPEKELFAVYVHPSSFPELFSRCQETQTQLWVLLTNTMLGRSESSTAKIPTAPRTQEPSVDLDSSRSQSSEPPLSVQSTSSEPFRVVARLKFATRVSFSSKEATSNQTSGNGPSSPTVSLALGQALGEGTPGVVPELEVKTGHILMSEAVRQQLCIGACFVVKMQLARVTPGSTVYLCPVEPSEVGGGGNIGRGR